MTDPGRCPLPDELTQMLLGRLPAARSAEMEAHLDGCQRCLSVVKGLHIESQVVQMFKAQPWDDAAEKSAGPSLEELMTHLQDLHPTDGARNTPPSAQTADVPRLAPAEGPDEIGRLAHFRVLSLLGAGGMGVVYMAEDTRLRRAIALKVLRPRFARDAEAHDRFLREARAIAAIKHDQVVVIHDVGDTLLPGDTVSTPYLAMELLEGTSLDAWMRDNPRPPITSVVRLGRQIAEALAALHARGLVHRDLKPANLWLERIENAARSGSAAPKPGSVADFRLKLLDFGLALTTASGPDERRALGTPAYMAPEQLYGEPVDARSDLFSLGCVLYELCTSELPFPDRRFVSETPPPLPVSDFSAQIPPRLSQLISQLLEDRPERRPDSTRKVVRALAEIESRLTRPPRWGRRIALAAVAACVLGGLLVAGLVDSPLRRLFVAAPPSPPPPSVLDEPWCKDLRNLTPKQQFNAVVKKLTELNPTYNAQKVAGWIEPDIVLRFSEKSDQLTTIEPVRCLVDLKTVALNGTAAGKGQLTSIEALRGLRLANLEVARNPNLRDISVVREMPLNNLDISDTAVETLADIVDQPLEELLIARTPIRDLTPLAKMTKLTRLDCKGCPIQSLEPLVTTRLDDLTFDYEPARDDGVLKRLTHLKKINGSPVAEFWAKHPK